jgi:signal peptidase II
MESTRPARALFLGFAMAFPALALVALDQWTKSLAATRLAGRGVVRLAGDFIVLVFAQNKGAFLSLGSGLSPSSRGILLVALPAVVLFCLSWALVAQGHGGPGKASASVGRIAGRVAAVLVLSGGAGNLFDRIVYGEVRDFLNFRIGCLHTGIMNLADLYILAALVVVLVSLTRSKAGIKRAKDDETPPETG